MNDRPGPKEADTQSERPGEEGRGPVREMFLLAALYLPLGFFLWFSFASLLMWFPARLLEFALTGIFPELFERVVQLGFHLEIQTLVEMQRMVEGRIALLNLPAREAGANPMIYAWGMPLLFGLIMATPMTARRRALQLLVAYLVVSLVAVWGVFWEVWIDLAFNVGEEGARAVAEVGLPRTLIALCYQLGYLMLPAVVPMATWILMNRPFLERVAFGRRR